MNYIPFGYSRRAGRILQPEVYQLADDGRGTFVAPVRYPQLCQT